MSEQVRRYRFLIDGSHKGVVLASDYDALAQRCRGLEHSLAVKEEFYQDALHSHIVLVSQRDALRAEIDEARRTAGFWKDEHLAGNRVIDQLRAEVTGLKDKNEDLVFALSDAESRANNAGRNATAFEDRMGDLQVANGNLRDEIAQYRDIAYARVDECGELRAEIADLKAALLEAERGNEELVRLSAERRTLRVALARIADRAEAFVSDDASMKPHSAGAVAMIARKALEASHDEG